MSKLKPAAILGDFANYKPVLGRKVLALTIEVPIERAAEVFAALGYPTGGDSIPVAVARLEESASLTQPAPKDVLQAVEETGEEANRKLADKIDDRHRKLERFAPEEPARLRHWAEMSPAQQTGVIRNESDFWDFAGVHDAVEARDFIRRFCMVKSCADIVPGTPSAAWWAQLQVRYGNWLRTARGAA